MSGWSTKRPEPEQAPKPPSRPLGCDTCRGHGHPDGWIEWDVYVGTTLQRTVVTRCYCAGGRAERPPLRTVESCEVHQVVISDTARTKAEASWARRSDPEALARALGQRVARGVTTRMDQLRPSNWGQVLEVPNERPRPRDWAMDAANDRGEVEE